MCASDGDPAFVSYFLFSLVLFHFHFHFLFVSLKTPPPLFSRSQTSSPSNRW